MPYDYGTNGKLVARENLVTRRMEYWAKQAQWNKGADEDVVRDGLEFIEDFVQREPDDPLIPQKMAAFAGISEDAARAAMVPAPDAYTKSEGAIDRLKSILDGEE